LSFVKQFLALVLRYLCSILWVVMHLF